MPAPNQAGQKRARLLRRSRHRIWIRDVQPYVFCQDYSPAWKKQGASAAFELYFVNEKAAVKFREIFEGTGALKLIEGVLGTNERDGRDGLLATLGVTGSGKVAPLQDAETLQECND